MKDFILKGIKFYQKYLSLETGFLGALFPNQRVCRFVPSCSQYALEAVEKFGTIRGLYLGVSRILRCHPANTGGFDPIP